MSCTTDSVLSSKRRCSVSLLPCALVLPVSVVFRAVDAELAQPEEPRLAVVAREEEL